MVVVTSKELKSCADLIPCGVVLLVAFVLLPISSWGQQKNKQNKDTVTKVDATLQDYTDLAQVKEIAGKIADVDVKEQTMTFTIEWSSVQPNPNPPNLGKKNQKAAQLQQQLTRNYNTAMSSNNPIHRQQALMRFQQHLQQLQATGNAIVASMFQVVKSSKDFTVTIVDNVKVAKLQLETKYNDEGEEVKYTAAELKKLKSTDITGAYKAAPDDLKIGQSVVLYLIPPKKQDTKKTDKDAKKTDSDSSKSDKDAKKADTDTKKSDADAKKTDTNAKKSDQDAKKSDSSSSKGYEKAADSASMADRPQIRMVLITDDPVATDTPDTATKKKKDK